MTARHDLDNAFSILDAGITAHVAALKSAHAAVADESYFTALTSKVLAFADTLNASNPAVAAPVVPAAVIADAPPVPVVAPVAPVPAPVLPAPQVTPVAPVILPTVPAAPAATAYVAPGTNAAAPSVLQTLEDAIKAMVHK